MKSRSFAELLAEWQGGIKARSGESFTIPEEIPAAVIRKAWGSIPAAIAFEEAKLMFNEVRPGYYRVTIHWTK